MREQVESQRLALESVKLKRQLALVESVTDSVFGTPIPYEQINSYRGQPLIPLWFRDVYQHKATTLRMIQDVDRSRNLARYAYETNPNAQAVVNGLCAFVVGGGYDVAVTPVDDEETPGANESSEEPRKTLAKRAQKIIDEFIAVNELAEAKDGNPIYDELFIRGHVEGEAFLRLFADEIEPTKVRFVEPDNIRPPHGADYEGPWAMGVLSEERDTQTIYGYNVNWPRVDQDEFVESYRMHHLKLNAKKNQKRGISSLYSVDEDLRGTQKLRYAAREGAKIRASIAYIRQHQQADVTAINALQNGVLTAEAPRTNQWGGDYNVQVQQIEPGTVQDIPEGLEYKSAPADPNNSEVEASLRAGLQSLAARFSAPEWLASGASNDSSFAASLTAESPFLRRIIKEQSRQTGFWKAVFVSVLEIAIEQGRLDDGAIEQLHITVVAHSPQVRNKKDEADTNKVLYDEGVISLQQWSADSDHDFDEQQSQIKEEEERGLGKPPMPMLGQPGQFDQQPGGNEPETVGGIRQREEGVTEQERSGYVEAAVAGYAIGLRENLETSAD